jgi:hypothetical protein
MSEPIIPQKSPFVQAVQPGTYFWCACGRSATQPFCDGAQRYKLHAEESGNHGSSDGRLVWMQTFAERNILRWLTCPVVNDI